MNNSQKGSAAPLIISAVAILIVAVLFFVFKSETPVPAGNTAMEPAKPFSPLNPYASPAVTANRTDNQSSGEIPYASTAENAQSSNYQTAIGNAPADQTASQVAQTYQIQNNQSDTVSSGQFVTDTAAQESAAQNEALSSVFQNLSDENAVYNPQVAQTQDNQYASTDQTDQTDQNSQGSTDNTGGQSSSGGTGGGIGSGGGSGSGNSALGSLLGGLAGGLVGGIMNGIGGSGVTSAGGSGGTGGGGSGSFGGSITDVTYCTCGVSMLLDINQSGGQTLSLLYQPGASTLYEEYNVFVSGANVLGTYSQGGGQCEVYEGEECQSEGNPTGTITKIGTSAI